MSANPYLCFFKWKILDYPLFYQETLLYPMRVYLLAVLAPLGLCLNNMLHIFGKNQDGILHYLLVPLYEIPMTYIHCIQINGLLVDHSLHFNANSSSLMSFGSYSGFYPCPVRVMDPLFKMIMVIFKIPPTFNVAFIFTESTHKHTLTNKHTHTQTQTHTHTPNI